ncbi:MAG: 23S rRNA (pseudouridine(1915)-N(3))-methyltransferase RlmH [Variibacter sp.]
MRLVVAAVGKLKRGPERELAERYRERLEKLARSIGLRVEVVEITESRNRDIERRKIEESIALATLIPEGAAVVLLEERGRALKTGDLVDALRSWRDGGRNACVFVIGGADGLAATLHEKADIVLAFGGLTWPHQLVRIMILEQLYRVGTVLAGHPYHRE